MFVTQVPRADRSRADSGSDECGDDDRANDNDRRDSVAAVDGLWEEAERMFLNGVRYEYRSMFLPLRH